MPLSPRVRRALFYAGAFAGGAALTVPLVAPELVRRRILHAITERTGLQAELAGVDVGTDQAHLFGLRLSGHLRSGAAVEATFEDITLTIDPWTVLDAPLESIERVLVRGGTLHLTAADVEADSDGASTGAEPSASRALPPIEVEQLALGLADATGSLVRAAMVSARYDERGGEVTAREVTVEGGPAWSITRIGVAATRAAQGLLLSRFAIEGAALAVRGNERERVDRIRTALRAIRGAHMSEATGDLDTDLLDRLDGTFTAELRNVSVEVEHEATDDASSVVPSLRELDATVTREGDLLSTRGSARPGERGRLRWSLEVEPRALLASGTVDLEGVSLAVLTPLLPALPFHRPELAELSGTLSLERAGVDEVRGSGTLDVLNLGFSSPRLSATPIEGIAFGVRGTASWAPLTRSLTLEEVVLHAPSTTRPGAAAELQLRGTVVWAPSRYVLELHASLPSTPCNDAVHAIPEDILGELAPVVLDGRIGGSIDVSVDAADLEQTTLRIRVADACRFVSVPPFASPTRFMQPFHHRAVESDGDVFEMDTGPGTLAWTPISQMSPFLIHAVVAHEDASFFVHEGFAPWAIRDALVANLRAGRYVRGASTITMQLVKNAFLHREKTLVRKVQEVLLTWWVENAMTKEQILELYFNVIELGDGVYGIRDAAHTWFGRTPAELNAAESVYLAMILPNPPAFSAEHRREGRPPEPFRRRMATFLRHLGERGRFDAAAVAAGLSDIEAMRFFHPDEAPPGSRTLVGSTSILPIGAFEVGAIDMMPADGETDGDADGEANGAGGGEPSWDRWEEVVP